MSDVPRSPARFFQEYVPARVAKLAEGLAGRSSPGSIAFEIEGESYTLRLAGGRLLVEPGKAGDALLSVYASASDFEQVIVGGAERLDGAASPEQELVALRALTLEEDRAVLLRQAEGTVKLTLKGGAGEHALYVTVGKQQRKSEPDCEVECALDDLWAIQSGTVNPIQLLLDGKLRIAGNAELALNVGGALG